MPSIQTAQPVTATITAHVTLGPSVYDPLYRPPFIEDLKYGLLKLVKERIKAATPPKSHVRAYFFHPKPQRQRHRADGKGGGDGDEHGNKSRRDGSGGYRLGHGRDDGHGEVDGHLDALTGGCFCDDPESPYTHNWTNCPNIIPLFDIDKHSAKLQICRHGLLPPQSHLDDHWFCFQPAQLVMSYMAFLTAVVQPATATAHLADPSRAEAEVKARQAEDETNVDPEQARQVRRALREYHSRLQFDTGAVEQAASADEQAGLLCRVISAMRLHTRPPSERHRSWVEEHQIRRLLKWDDKSFDDALDELSGAMVAVKFDRLNPVVANMLDNQPKDSEDGS